MKNRLFYSLAKTHSALTRAFRDEIKKRGINITTGQMGILFLLQESGKTTMGDISRLLYMDNAATTRLVDRLFEKNLVDRNPDPDDRRRWVVTLTPQGLETTNHSRNLVIDMNRKIREVLSEDEEQHMIELSQKLYDAFSNKKFLRYI